MMGITIISTSSASTVASSPAQAASMPGDGLPGGFAALLSGQIGNAASLASSLPSGTATKEEDDSGTDNKATSDLIATDPALALFMAIPAQAIPATTPSLSLAASDMASTKGVASEAGNALSDQLPIQSKAQEEKAGSPLLNQSAYQDDFATALKLKTQTEQGAAANIAAETLAQAPAQQDSSAALAAGAAAQQRQATQAQSASTEVTTPLHADNWSHNFSEKIVWLAKNDQQTAQININPPQLGPVQITLHMNGDQATAIFASPHAEVRQAIESSLSQLKEMLAGAGINLGQADVGANMAQQNREAPFQSANGNRSTGENAILPGIGNTVDNTVSTPVQRGRGMVDLFA